MRSGLGRFAACAAALAGCAGAGAAGERPTVALARVAPAERLEGALDPTVRGARLVPLEPAEPGARWIANGVRVEEGPSGAVAAAADRLPSSPTLPSVDLPDRVGGGHLFALGSRLWRADTWLGEARPLVAFGASIAHVWVGLDRVYVATSDNALGAIDGRTGALLDRGPLPSASAVTRLGAIDAWHALAIADLRGPLFTSDAGATWRPVALPAMAADVVPLEGSLLVTGSDASRWELRADGQVSPLPPATRTRSLAAPDERGALKVLGGRPLAAVVEDGWPLRDGTGLVARDGLLARVRLSDGAVLGATAAFALKPARCHAIPLPRREDPGGFGFVCGEPGAETRVYRFLAAEERMAELGRFDAPREVLASGNGALAVRGPCAAPGASGADEVWCLLGAAPGATWSEIRLAGPEASAARVVALSDDRVAFVRPPHGSDLTTARLTLVDATGARHLPLVMPELKADAGRALREGLWLDGFEERRPGVLGGWVDAGGPMVGVEIDLDGHARVGEVLREGAPFVSGRWGFAWTASRRGFETTDGGMTWNRDLDLPEPLQKPRLVASRSCGPIGCLAAGWIRVGWGNPAAAASPPAPARVRTASRATAPLDLMCEVFVGAAPRPAPAPRAVSGGASVGRGSAFGSGAGPGCRTSFDRFQSLSPPAIGGDACGLEVDVTSATGLARVEAWGPLAGDWAGSGRWEASWLWPWGGAADARRSAASLLPAASRDDTAHVLGLGPTPMAFTLFPGDDADHALLVGRTAMNGRPALVLGLESEGAVTTVQWPSFDAPADVLSATRAGGRWFLASAAPTSASPAIVVWVVEGATARELARVPRAFAAPPASVRLARRSDSSTIGLVIDGQAGLDRGIAPRWVLPIDADGQGPGEMDLLHPLEGPEGPPAPCAGDEQGWVVDVAYGGAVRLRAPAGWMPLDATAVRARLGREHACLERIHGSVPGGPRAALAGLRGSGIPNGPRITVGVHDAHERFAMRCAASAAR